LDIVPITSHSHDSRLKLGEGKNAEKTNKKETKEEKELGRAFGNPIWPKGAYELIVSSFLLESK
jgi:hypothetical protein